MTAFRGTNHGGVFISFECQADEHYQKKSTIAQLIERKIGYRKFASSRPTPGGFNVLGP